MSSTDDGSALASLPGLTTARVADTLDQLGHRQQVCTPVLRAVGPGMRLVGRAVTVAFEGDDVEPGDDPYAAMIALIDGLRRGDVLVIAAGGDDRTAYWGQLFSAAARGHGAHGVVCDGPVRDMAQIVALDFPVFATGSRPVDYRGRMRVCSTGESVSVAGVPVSPGDTVIADDDGVVIVPAAVDAIAAERMSARAEAEGLVLDELLGGASLRQVWDRHRVL